MPAPFATVRAWVEAGHLETGFYLLEQVARETEKAVGFTAQRFNAAANLVPGVCWIPKSQLRAVPNDFYTHGPATMYLVPAWLCQQRTAEGWVLF